MAVKGFRQIDTEYFLAVLAADLTRAGTKVLLAVIHFTLGYNQRDSADISLTTFQNLTKLSRPAVKTAIKELIAYGLITLVRQGSTDKQPAIYNLNTNFETWTGKVGLPSGGKVGLPSETSKTYPVDAENLPSTGQVPTPATEPLKKERKLLKKTNNDPFDAEWVALSEQIINYYFKSYREHEGKVHPALKPEQKQRVVTELWAFADEKSVIDLQGFQAIIDYHFQRKLTTDWNINHFATPGILENLFYKNLY